MKMALAKLGIRAHSDSCLLNLKSRINSALPAASGKMHPSEMPSKKALDQAPFSRRLARHTAELDRITSSAENLMDTKLQLKSLTMRKPAHRVVSWRFVTNPYRGVASGLGQENQ